MTFDEKPASIDCGLGHACTFCPQQEACDLDKPNHNRVLIEGRLEEIDQIILVLANKGGVGKSTVSANLAAGLAAQGFQVGVADADVHGPNQSRFFGFAGSKVRLGDGGLETKAFQHAALKKAIKVGSLAFLLESDDTPVVWRDSYKHDFMHHLIGSFDWGPLDYLIVDMPPGTGNELITLCDMLEGANVSALMVTTPQAVAMMDSMKAVRFCRERGLPIIGALSNMAGMVCPHCSNEIQVFPDANLKQALAEAEVPLLGQIPLAIELASASDEGTPVVLSEPEKAVAQAFNGAIEGCTAIGRSDFNGAVARALDDVFDENLNDQEMESALAGVPDAEQGAVRAAVKDLLSEESQRLHQAADVQSEGHKP